MLVSPIILARVLSVEDFGRYREFLLYGTLLQALGRFRDLRQPAVFHPRTSEQPVAHRAADDGAHVLQHRADVSHAHRWSIT